MRLPRVLFLLLVVISFSFARAQDATDKQLSNANVTSIGSETEKTALDLFHVDGSYVFGSDIKTRDNYGSQDEIESEAAYSHRFHLTGNVYFRAGLAYQRFDFGKTLAPLPLHLQSYSSLLSVEYMHGNDIGAFFQIQPGFYTEDDINISSFDVPITAGRIFVLKPDQLYLFVGVNASFLRSEYSPVLPLLGIVYMPTKEWIFNFVPPDPRIIYAPNKHWDFFVGGQITGSSFRTDHKDNPPFPQKLNGAAVDYVEWRTGGGLTYSPTDQISIDLIGGYVIERQFDFGRAEKKYNADGAPYVRLSFKAEF